MMNFIPPIMTRKSVATVTVVEKQIVRWSMTGHALSSALPVVEASRSSVMTATERVGKTWIEFFSSKL
ncbi:hypothetical protein C1H69_01120 [Billgrantia endophytica]|uniref:Uncharacterized protein n=1 Tax=Billgrantia endophytica TaxID=2033802 RepID=A0A2N7UBW6_9GAMM|nr:hypothetical protein C1H69_01120 [Halomonas endophytica]